MDRYINTDEATFLAGKVKLDVKFVAGTAGAVPTSLAGYLFAQGISGMVLTATGVYEVDLQDTYTALTKATFTVIPATYNATHAVQGFPIIDSVSSGTAPLVTFQAVIGVGTAAAVTAGDVVMISLELTRQAQNS